MRSFTEWLAGLNEGKKPSIKNKDIDAFLKAVDNLKRDLDELDAQEKKPKKKVPDKKDEPPEEKPETDIDGDVDIRRPGKSLRPLPDEEISTRPVGGRGKPNRKTDTRTG